MLYSIIAAYVVVGLVGIKKPLYGGLAGLIVAPLLHLIFFEFDKTLFIILLPIGFVSGFFIASIFNRLFQFFMYGPDDDDKRPHYRSMHHGSGGAWGGGIIYTDEEEKNAKQNEENTR